MRKTEKEFVPCPGCNVSFNKLGFEKHLKVKHPDMFAWYKNAKTASGLLMKDAAYATKQAFTPVDLRTSTSDPVNHPAHYTFGKYEVLDVLRDWFPDDPVLWQVTKYIARANHKGVKLQDLKKARFYLNEAIKETESNGKEI